MVIILPNIELLRSCLPLPSALDIGIPLISNDGRVAISHPFCEEDIDAFKLISEAVIADSLPDDWIE